MNANAPSRALRTPDAGRGAVLALAPVCLLADSLILGATIAPVVLSTAIVSRWLVQHLQARWSALGTVGASLMLSASWVALLDILLQWLLPDLRSALGPYAPLTVGTCLLLSRAAPDNPGVGHGLGMAIWLPLVSGGLREVLGRGQCFGDLGMLGIPAGALRIFPAPPLPLMALTPGALLILAVVLSWQARPGTRPSTSGEGQQ